MFDPEQFMQQTTESTFETERTLIPPGEYQALIDECSAKVLGEKNSPALGLVLHPINVDQEILDEVPNVEDIKLYHTIWLDISESGGLATGTNKNIALGQLLEAIGKNGKPWSPMDIPGNVVMIDLTHRVNKSSGKPEEQIRAIRAS